MAATPARIGFILQPFRRAIAENATIKAQFGLTARKSDDPVEAYFDNVADADVMANERLALQGSARRRFAVRFATCDEIAVLDHSGRVPVLRYRDDERETERGMLVTEITIDLAKQSASIGLWG